MNKKALKVMLLCLLLGISLVGYALWAFFGFYGKVVDEKGNPLSNARVKMSSAILPLVYCLANRFQRFCRPCQGFARYGVVPGAHAPG